MTHFIYGIIGENIDPFYIIIISFSGTFCRRKMKIIQYRKTKHRISKSKKKKKEQKRNMFSFLSNGHELQNTELKYNVFNLRNCSKNKP